MQDEQTPEPADILEFERLPASTYEFIRMLDKNVPHRCIGFNETEAQARYYAAQRDMIDRWVSAVEQELEADREADEGQPDPVISTIKRPKSKRR